MTRLTTSILALAAMSVCVPGCSFASGFQQSAEHRLRASRTYRHAPTYLEAVANAEDAGPAEISRQLTAITPANADLLWRTFDDGIQRVLVVTWTTNKDYYPAKGTQYIDEYEVWVSAAPQVKQFIQQNGTSGPALNLRLEQLLGLPAGSNHNYFVELWVDPAHLFRPSADPEITDHEAELDFPGVPDFLAVSETYRAWYQNQVRARYQPTEGPPYPWTRLGYTYDWGNPNSRVGLSEFVVRPGATVVVESRTPTDDYGALPNPRL